MENNIFNEDCIVTLNRKLEYDYVITSPPDFEEIDMDVLDIILYKRFLNDRLSLLNPKGNLATIFVTNRKSNGGIIEKDRMIIDIMLSNGWQLQSKKVWIKSYKINQFRPNYTNILTFRKNKRFVPHIQDCWYEEFKSASKEYTYNFSEKIVQNLIFTLTNEDDVVYDPFIGSGTTLKVCETLNRGCIGSEIDTDTFNKFLK
jgi:DNA modification methylase